MSSYALAFVSSSSGEWRASAELHGATHTHTHTHTHTRTHTHTHTHMDTLTWTHSHAEDGDLSVLGRRAANARQEKTLPTA